MAQKGWTKKRELQDEHIKDGLLDRGESEEIASRTVDKAELEKAVGR